MCRSIQDQKTSVILNEQVDFACFKPLVNTWGSLNANAHGNPRQVLVSNRAKFMHQRKPKIYQFLREGLDAIWSSLFSCGWMDIIGLSEFKHDFDLLFFNDGVRKSSMANGRKKFSGYFPKIRIFSSLFRRLGMSVFCSRAAKNLKQPIDQFLVSVGNLNVVCKISGFRFFVARMASYVNASLTVNNSSKICKLFFSDIFKHFLHIVDDTLIIQDDEINVQPQRLTPVAP